MPNRLPHRWTLRPPPLASEAAPVSPPEAAPPVTGAAPAAGSAMAPAEAANSSPRVTDALLPSTLPRDLSPWGMFLSAVVPVKIVMVGLALASLATWTVWLAKTIELWMAKRSARRSLEMLAHATSLRAAEKELGPERSPVARFVAAAVGEADRSDGLATEGVKDRAATLLSRIEAHAGRMIMRGTGVLATVGATAPFIGLFGTVWGIMDSFIGISKTNTTNLAVVAPGIAEALLATAMGLVAAIPAVVMYNGFRPCHHRLPGAAWRRGGGSSAPPLPRPRPRGFPAKGSRPGRPFARIGGVSPDGHASFPRRGSRRGNP